VNARPASASRQSLPGPRTRRGAIVRLAGSCAAAFLSVVPLGPIVSGGFGVSGASRLSDTSGRSVGGVGVGAGIAVAATGPSRIDIGAGAEYHLRRWDNSKGGLRASEFLLPIDVAWRTRGVRLGAGADFARSDAIFPEGPAGDVTLGEVRAGSEFSVFRDRLRVAAGTRVPYSTDGLGPEEALTAGLLDEVALGFPRARHPGGPRLLVEAGVQPVRRSDLVLQTGMAWEWRGAYDVLNDGRRLDPGDPWRLVAGIRTGRGVLLGDLDLRWERAGESAFDGGYSYREGDALTARVGLRRQLDQGHLDFAGVVVSRSRGSVQAGAPLDVSALRGGNAVRIELSTVRFARAGDVGLSLGVLGVRAYAGDLGHAGALEPGLSWAPRAAGGRLTLAGRGMIGRCRGDRPLRGLDVSLSWQREWRP
jgi:hypothetical protein